MSKYIIGLLIKLNYALFKKTCHKDNGIAKEKKA